MCYTLRSWSCVCRTSEQRYALAEIIIRVLAIIGALGLTVFKAPPLKYHPTPLKYHSTPLKNHTTLFKLAHKPSTAI